ncbi:di-trans,poly-cis-decaprenylcistransferase [Candidatus Korobacter versatilis]|nr:di-trans,poly-cis-decaprenylcistransferase [Candidatus Koribacter versatilis]
MRNNFAVQSESGLHVAIIMDGNGRWATQRGLPRAAGHRAGVAAVRRTVEHAPDFGVRRLTVYAFSADNWRRPSAEVQSIFWLIRAYLRIECERLRSAGVRLEAIGRRDRIPKGLLSEIERVESITAANRKLELRVAVDYSSRDAIARACAGLPESASPKHVRAALDASLSAGHGDVDLLIRTGGEKRLSDFLLWESAYAEFHFTPCMWPDFQPADLDAAINAFRARERRFGSVPAIASVPALQIGGTRWLR